MSAGEPKSKQAANGCDRNRHHNQQRPFVGLEHGVEDDEDEEDSDRKYDEQPRVSPLLALVFPLPVEAVSGGQFDLLVHFLDRFFDRAAKVTAADTVLDGNITPIALAVNFRCAIGHADLAELRERHPFARGR